MHIGLFGINMNFMAQPAWALRVAQHAEALGFESVWTGEHVVLPDPREAPSPAAPETPMLHPPALLAYLASATTTLKLGTRTDREQSMEDKIQSVQDKLAEG